MQPGQATITCFRACAHACVEDGAGELNLGLEIETYVAMKLCSFSIIPMTSFRVLSSSM